MYSNMKLKPNSGIKKNLEFSGKKPSAKTNNIYFLNGVSVKWQPNYDSVYRRSFSSFYQPFNPPSPFLQPNLPMKRHLHPHSYPKYQPFLSIETFQDSPKNNCRNRNKNSHIHATHVHTPPSNQTKYFYKPSKTHRNIRHEEEDDHDDSYDDGNPYNWKEEYFQKLFFQRKILAITTIFLNPLFGSVALLLSCMYHFFK